MMSSKSSIVGGMVRKDIKMAGKTVLITGANTGIGLATAVDMAERGARVLMACRNKEKGETAREIVIEKSKSDNVVLKILDLSSLSSVRECAEDIYKTEDRLDVLINNAGIMMCPQMKTKDGFEMQFGTNHLGHFLLTNLLLDLLKKSAPSRVVTVSSLAHYWYLSGAKVYWNDMNLENNYTPTRAYGQSKLMNVLFSRELSKRVAGSGVTAYSVEPGAVATDLQRHLGSHERPSILDRLFSLANWTRRWWRTPEQGAQTQIYCAVAPELEGETGRFYSNCKVATESWDGQRDDYARRLWEISEELTKLKE